MKYLVGLKPLQHNAKYNVYSVLLEIDWYSQKVLRELKIPSASFSSNDGYMRSNAQGCILKNGKIYLTQWNFITIIDYNSFEVIDSFSHPLMSDVHGMEIVDDEIFICSTGIDAVLCFDINTYQLKRMWRPENSLLDKKVTIFPFLYFLRVKSSKFYKRMKDIKLENFLVNNFKLPINYKDEYRGLDKTRSGLHSHHLNEISCINDELYVLTKGWNNTISSSLIRLTKKLKNEVFILPPGSLNGAHDIFFDNNKIIFTESGIESLAIYSIDSNNLLHHKLTNNNYFIRGLEKYKDDYLVGFTPPRNDKKNRHAFITQYDASITNVKTMNLNYYSNEIGCAIHFIYKIKE